MFWSDSVVALLDWSDGTAGIEFGTSYKLNGVALFVNSYYSYYYVLVEILGFDKHILEGVDTKLFL